MNPTSTPKIPPIGSVSDDGPLTFEKVWVMFQETDKKYQEPDKKLNKLEPLFTSQWGKLVESLVEGDSITILNLRGIVVTDTIKRRSDPQDDVDYEFDIIAINGTENTIIEVKTTLRSEDIRNFTKKLKQAKNWMPEYTDRTIYGTVAFLTEDAGTAAMEANMGLL